MHELQAGDEAGRAQDLGNIVHFEHLNLEVRPTLCAGQSLVPEGVCPDVHVKALCTVISPHMAGSHTAACARQFVTHRPHCCTITQCMVVRMHTRCQQHILRGRCAGSRSGESAHLLYRGSRTGHGPRSKLPPEGQRLCELLQLRQVTGAVVACANLWLLVSLAAALMQHLLQGGLFQCSPYCFQHRWCPAATPCTAGCLSNAAPSQ